MSGARPLSAFYITESLERLLTSSFLNSLQPLALRSGDVEEAYAARIVLEGIQ